MKYALKFKLFIDSQAVDLLRNMRLNKEEFPQMVFDERELRIPYQSFQQRTLVERVQAGITQTRKVKVPIRNMPYSYQIFKLGRLTSSCYLLRNKIVLKELLKLVG